jgi:hypothetical protein
MDMERREGQLGHDIKREEVLDLAEGLAFEIRLSAS